MAEARTLTINEATKIVSDEEPETNTMNAFAGAKVSFLNTELSIKFQKNGDDCTFLLAPKKTNGTEGNTTLKDLIDAVANLFGSTTLPQNNLENLLGTQAQDFAKIYIKLTMAFLYVKKVNSKTEVEYAFMIETKNLDSIFPKGFENVFKLKDIQLAIYNTKNTNVIKAMEITTPEDALNELGYSQN